MEIEKIFFKLFEALNVRFCGDPERQGHKAAIAKDMEQKAGQEMEQGTERRIGDGTRNRKQDRRWNMEQKAAKEMEHGTER